MSVLSDRTLRLVYPDSDPGPASIDLHLGDTLSYWPHWIVRDPRTDQSDQWRPVRHDTDLDGWVLVPGVRYLAATREWITMRPDTAGQIAARSSFGRDGLSVICGPAGFIDPGFEGHIVLELSVIGSQLVLWPGARVAQLVVTRLTTPAERPYSGRYMGQEGVTPSRFHTDWQEVGS